MGNLKRHCVCVCVCVFFSESASDCGDGCWRQHFRRGSRHLFHPPATHGGVFCPLSLCSAHAILYVLYIYMQYYIYYTCTFLIYIYIYVYIIALSSPILFLLSIYLSIYVSMYLCVCLHIYLFYIKTIKSIYFFLILSPVNDASFFSAAPSSSSSSADPDRPLLRTRFVRVRLAGGHRSHRPLGRIHGFHATAQPHPSRHPGW